MPVMERIQAEVEQHPIVLFMKGTPQFPMCGFSSRAVQALVAAGADQLRTVNVLEEPEIRANLPRYSNWPTFPQLFIHGELIGGCDITMELFEAGELKRIVSEAKSGLLLMIADIAALPLRQPSLGSAAHCPSAHLHKLVAVIRDRNMTTPGFTVQT